MKSRHLPTIIFFCTLGFLQKSLQADIKKHRISYYKNGEIHVNQLGEPDQKPLTSGHWDFKPSWSKTDDKLVFSVGT